MEVAIVVICTIFAGLLLAAVIFKAVAMGKQMKRYREELARLAENEKYLLDIVQDGKTVRIECRDVNSENVELLAAKGEEE